MTISFNTHDPNIAADIIAAMLLGQSNHIQFDPDGEQSTVARRYGDGTWGVAFRPAGERTRRQYGNPVEAARAIIAGRHPAEDAEIRAGSGPSDPR